jgi:hypothetical protein
VSDNLSKSSQFGLSPKFANIQASKKSSSSALNGDSCLGRSDNRRFLCEQAFNKSVEGENWTRLNMIFDVFFVKIGGNRWSLVDESTDFHQISSKFNDFSNPL